MIISFMGIVIIAAFTFESLPKALDDLFLCEHFDVFFPGTVNKSSNFKSFWITNDWYEEKNSN